MFSSLIFPVVKTAIALLQVCLLLLPCGDSPGTELEGVSHASVFSLAAGDRIVVASTETEMLWSILGGSSLKAEWKRAIAWKEPQGGLLFRVAFYSKGTMYHYSFVEILVYEEMLLVNGEERPLPESLPGQLEEYFAERYSPPGFHMLE